MPRRLAWLILSSILAGAGAASGQANLILNGGGESDVGSSDGYTQATISTWTQSGAPNVVQWAVGGGFPSAASPGPDARGANYFTGGGSISTQATLSQTLDVSSAAAGIDAGTMPFTLCGFLGGFSGQNDGATVLAQFLNGSAGEIGSASIGPVLAADRNSQTSLCLVTTSGLVPGGTRSVVITVTFDELAGPYNDGYADNLNFLLAASCPETGGGCMPPTTTTTSTSSSTTTSSTSSTLPTTTSTTSSTSSSTTSSTSTSTSVLPTTSSSTSTAPTTSLPPTTTPTSTVVPTTATTTTVPPGCAPAMTFPSIRCRLEALVEDVGTAGDLGVLQAKLESLASDALAKADAAETATRARQRKNLLKAVAKKLASFSARVRSRKGRNTIPEGTRTRVTGAADAIRTDVLALRRAP